MPVSKKDEVLDLLKPAPLSKAYVGRAELVEIIDGLKGDLLNACRAAGGAEAHEEGRPSCYPNVRSVPLAARLLRASGHERSRRWTGAQQLHQMVPAAANGDHAAQEMLGEEELSRNASLTLSRRRRRRTCKGCCSITSGGRHAAVESVAESSPTALVGSLI